MHIFESAPTDMWQEVARKCPWATYFHTPQWAAIIVKTFPAFSFASLGFISGSEARGVIPFVARKKKGLANSKKEYKSMEPGVYGGIIADGDIGRDELDQVTSYLLKMKKVSGRIVGTPFKQFDFSPGFKSKDISTHIVALEAEFETLRKKFSRGQKSNINQAKKKKVLVRRAETEDDIAAYDNIYRQTIVRWGEDPAAGYPISLFLNIYRSKDPNACFWLAEVEGKTVAGVIIFSWNKRLIYWHGGALKEYYNYYPNNLLHATVMEWGCRHGFETYDMGASMGLEGVARFKESFGAKPHKFISSRWK